MEEFLDKARFGRLRELRKLQVAYEFKLSLKYANYLKRALKYSFTSLDILEFGSGGWNFSLYEDALSFLLPKVKYEIHFAYVHLNAQGMKTILEKGRQCPNISIVQSIFYNFKDIELDKSLKYDVKNISIHSSYNNESEIFHDYETLIK